MPDALDWRRRRPRPPIRGDRLGRALGLAPGPWVGPILAELEQAAFAGEIAGEQEAVDCARTLLGSGPTPDR